MVDQNSDLMDVQEQFSQLLTTNKLTPKIAQKLSILQLSIFKYGENINTSFFNELSEVECQALIKLNKQAKVQMFVQIIHNLGDSNLLKGQIEIKTKTLGRWKTKKFIINIQGMIFEIPRKNGKKQSKPDRSIELEFYSLNIMKLKHNRNRFKLQALQRGKGYYKSLVCGTTDTSIFNTVVDLLKTLCFSNDETIITKINKIDVQVVKTNLSLQHITAENENGQQPPKTNPPSATLKNFNWDDDQQLNHNNSISSSQEDPFHEKDHQLQLHLNEDESEKKRNNTSETKKKVFKEIIFKSNSLKFKVNRDPNQTNSTEQVQQKIIQESPILEPSPFQNHQNQVMKDNPHDFILEEKMHQERDLRIPLLFQKLVDDGMLVDSYLDQNFTLFSTIYNQQNLEILRSNNNPLLFRSIFNLDSSDSDRVFQIFAEIEFMKKWNGNINSDESKFIALIQSERSAIIHEKRKQYGMFYLPRDYVYLRNVFEREGKQYIVDKSIEHEDCPQQYKVIRGEINYQMIRIEKKSKQTIVVSIESEITNGGFSTTEQDGHITQIYLQEIKNITSFLVTYNNQPIIQSPLLNSLQHHRLHLKHKLQFQQLPAKTVIEDFPEQSSAFDKKIQDEIDFDEEPPELSFKRRLSEDQEQQQLTIQRKLSVLPGTGTYQAQGIIHNEKQNEIKNLEKLQQNEDEEEDDDPNEIEYVPTEVMTSTYQLISQQYKDQVIKQIQTVEQQTFYKNCLDQKYINQPIDVKAQYITEVEGGNFFLKKDWMRDDKHGGLIFVNAKKLEAQKKIIKFMFKKIGSNLLQGKSILSISLPVIVFETRSNLERFSYAFVYAPRYLEEGAKMQTPEEQMKMTITFGLSAINMYISMEKPFNPILGETYQGLINGCPVYAEQITHHPPTCAFQLYGRGYKMDGHLESVANMSANSVQGKNVGYIRVTYYNTNAVQIYMMCPGSYSGITFGDKLFNISGQGYCVDQENQIVWDATFNPSKSSFFGKKTTPLDYITGGIYRVTKQAIQKFKKEGYEKYSGLDLNKDVVEKISDTIGIWNKYFEIDGEQTWNLKIFPFALSNHRNPLPSDSNYRLDILYWRLHDFEKAQKTKEILEIRQRTDNQLRSMRQSNRPH